MDRLYPEFKGKIQVHLYDSTQLNAFALPNGSVYFNIGLLARIANEAQLAAVLGHEAAHFIEKHSFRERVSAKNASAFAVSGIPFASLAAVSSISGFSRDLEREADMKGYARLVKGGLRPAGGAQGVRAARQGGEGAGDRGAVFLLISSEARRAHLTRSRSWPPSTRTAGAWARKTITKWCSRFAWRRCARTWARIAIRASSS
jgi:hypothetical protein